MAKIHDVANEFVYFRKTIEGMRKHSLEIMADGRRIQAHFSRMIIEYSDWEDRIKALDEQVDKLAAETGLTVNEIHSEVAIPQTLGSTSVMDDIFDDLSEVESKPAAKPVEDTSLLDSLLDL